MPKPDVIPQRARRSLIGSYKNKLDDPKLDEKIKNSILKVGVFDNQVENYQEQLRDLREAQQRAWNDAQEEIDKIQRELERVEGGIFYVEDLIITRHYYLEDERRNNNPGNPNNNPRNPN